MDYYLILDFEATCENNKRITPQETIEFPVLKVNAQTLETEAEFHSYVQPTVHTRFARNSPESRRTWWPHFTTG